MTPPRTVLRYHGGKFGAGGMLAKAIVELLPAHRVYTEAYGGAASVLMRKQRSYAEIYNDRWGAVCAVFRVLRDPARAEELKRRLTLTPFARDEFEAARETYDERAPDMDVAWRVIIRSLMGFGSPASNPNYKTGFRSNANRAGTTAAADWANYPSALDYFTERLRGVVIENREGVDVIRQHDCQDAVHFVDPPYVHAARQLTKAPHGKNQYVYELDDEDHRRLSAALHDIKGMAIVCGYHSRLYDELYGNWERIEIAALADGARPRTEVLWFNASAWANRPRIPRQHTLDVG